METLQAGDKIKTDTGQSLNVIKLIGEGGQGYVYEVEFGGKRYALKWYKKSEWLDHIDSEAFRKNLAKNIINGSPAPQFLWPKMLTEEIDGVFGYVMELFPNGYTSLDDYYWGDAYFNSWLAIIETALSLVQGFLVLHRMGYSYQDLNRGGFRANPSIYGPKRILICDNDNVSPDGLNLGIQGFMGFMAPEVTIGSTLPSTQTDLHSLAVVLFGLFFRGHPLEGRDTLEYAALRAPGRERIMYGTNPVFCYDPSNDKNRPDPAVHINGVLHYWPIFPNEFKEYFMRTFTLGLSDPNKRVLEIEWREALINLRSSIVYLWNGNVPQEQFVNLNGAKIPPGCLRLRFTNGKIAAISHGSRLYAYQTANDPMGFWTITASVASYQDHLCMRNETDVVWRYNFPGQQSEMVKTQDILPLVPGVSINFSGIEAIVI